MEMNEFEKLVRQMLKDEIMKETTMKNPAPTPKEEEKKTERSLLVTYDPTNPLGEVDVKGVVDEKEDSYALLGAAAKLIHIASGADENKVHSCLVKGAIKAMISSLVDEGGLFDGIL
jgi:hypothetical protein